MTNVTEPDLMKLRQEIDRLDAILTDTLEKRMDVVQQVAAYKDTRNMQVLDREREEQVIAKVVGMLKNPAYAPHMKQIMEKIMETSRNLQIDILAANIKKKEQNADPICVGYQGGDKPGGAAFHGCNRKAAPDQPEGQFRIFSADRSLADRAVRTVKFFRLHDRIFLS